MSGLEGLNPLPRGVALLRWGILVFLRGIALRRLRIGQASCDRFGELWNGQATSVLGHAPVSLSSGHRFQLELHDASRSPMAGISSQTLSEGTRKAAGSVNEKRVFGDR